jgi:hypothetical protein
LESWGAHQSGDAESRPEIGDALAVGFDQRNIDAIERRAAHETDRPHPLCPLAPRFESDPRPVTPPPESLRRHARASTTSLRGKTWIAGD